VKGNYDMKTFILSHFMLVEYRLRKVLQWKKDVARQSLISWYFVQVAKVLKHQMELYAYEAYQKAKAQQATHQQGLMSWIQYITVTDCAVMCHSNRQGISPWLSPILHDVCFHGIEVYSYARSSK
jgi:hypothetical protein